VFLRERELPVNDSLSLAVILQRLPLLCALKIGSFWLFPPRLIDCDPRQLKETSAMIHFKPCPDHYWQQREKGAKTRERHLVHPNTSTQSRVFGSILDELLLVLLHLADSLEIFSLAPTISSIGNASMNTRTYHMLNCTIIRGITVFHNIPLL
jgi:hypothetical protein